MDVQDFPFLLTYSRYVLLRNTLGGPKVEKLFFLPLHLFRQRIKPLTPMEYLCKLMIFGLFFDYLCLFITA